MAEGLVEEVKRVLPWQRKTQRDNLALLTATMPDVRSANLMDFGGQVLMLALRQGALAVPLAWRVEATEGPIGFAVQKNPLEAVAPWLPEGAPACLMADRFHGTADLISLCQGLSGAA